MNQKTLVRFWAVITISMFSGSASFGQGFFDTAPRFGQSSLFGSAKSMGMGGIQMGTGAEGSALGVNPASPGMFRKSDIQLSLMPYLNSTTNSFRGSEVSADKSGFPIGSFSLSLASLKTEDESGDVRGGVFSVSYNRMAVFNRRSNWEGINNLYQQPNIQTDNSIIDGYLKNSNRPGFYPSNLINPNPDNQLIFNDNFKNDLIMAYNAYILDTSGNEFVSAFPRSDIKKTGYYDQSLNQGMWNIGYSINVKEKVFLGFSLGHVRGDYKSTASYGEEIANVYVDPSNPNYNYLQGFKGVNFQIMKNLEQKQRGINGNLGIIYKVSDAFRLSGSIQLPSLTWVNEKYSPRITANYNGLPNWANSSESLNSYDVKWFENSFAYKLRVPAKYRAGINWIAGKTGMLGVDIEYSDLSTTKLTEGDGGYNFVEENKTIQNTYAPTLNIKTGGEIRYGDMRFRLGFAYYPSPLKSNALYRNNVSKDALFYTGGLGAKYEGWYWDAGIVLGFSQTQYNFVPGIDQDIQTKFSSSQLRLGIGFNL